MKRQTIIRIIAIILCTALIAIPIIAAAQSVHAEERTEQSVETDTEDEQAEEEKEEKEEIAVPIDKEHFPDPAFREYVRRVCADGKDYLSNLDVELTTLVILDNIDAQSLEGMEYLSNVSVITLHNCNSLTKLDLSGLPSLSVVRVDKSRKLSAVNITDCPQLKRLLLTDTDVSYDTISLSDDEKLEALWIGNGVRAEIHKCGGKTHPSYAKIIER